MVTSTRSGRIPSNERCRSLRSALLAKRSSTRIKNVNVKIRGTSSKPSHFVNMDNRANKTAKLKKKKRLDARVYRASMSSTNTNMKKVGKSIKEGGEEHLSNDFEDMTVHCTDKSSSQLPLVSIANETDGSYKKASPLTQIRKKCTEQSIPSTGLKNKVDNDRVTSGDEGNELDSDAVVAESNLSAPCSKDGVANSLLPVPLQNSCRILGLDETLPEARDQLVRFENGKVECLLTPTEEDHTSPVEKDEEAAENAAILTRNITSGCAESLQVTQEDAHPIACTVCKHLGALLFCHGKGCRSSYHLLCLDPPLQDIPPGSWLCLCCVKKKLEFGVYSVSNGIESVWSVKEDVQSGKEYLVKYNGLAHVHNCWISESQLLSEAPTLVAKFNRKYQQEKVIAWKKEWTVPERLLQKRILMPQKLADDFFSQHRGLARCYNEWFVKWKGLGYEEATWELDNLPLLCSSEAMVLMEDYGRRHHEAKKNAYSLKSSMVKSNPKKMLKLPDGLLFEFWHKNQNAILVEDQNRVVTSILFIFALRSYTCRPFLVISTSTFLELWKAEFMHHAPSINVVLYSGNKVSRKIIRSVEFYAEGGSLMFQVLLSHPEAIAEDICAFECIDWESIIVDDCQNPGISKYFELFNQLSPSFRLLLLNGQLKDSVPEYVKLLPFLDSGGKEKCAYNMNSYSNGNTGSLEILKEKLMSYVADEQKSDSSKFLEYWVPVWLSNVQLELYCSILLSKSFALRSCSRVDLVGAVRDIVISVRKCCDHPFLVDNNLRSELIKGLPVTEYLNVDVNASGKLHLLDKILQEIKKKELKVVLLFQSADGTGRNRMGDYLDDFLNERFGTESYERIDNGQVSSKKASALEKFNSKLMGRFVLLIENRACLPSVKLISVDAVIIYDSDLHPLNDLKSLQKLSIESQFDQIKVFRLYTSFTIEEKALILARDGEILENSMQNVNSTKNHLLLSWGASYLFDKLDEFHLKKNLTSGTEASAVDLLMNTVTEELLKELQVIDIDRNTSKCSILVKALQSRMSYSRNIFLFGEKEGIVPMDIDPPSFWSNLLDGRSPCWKLISGLTQRPRRKPSINESDVQKREVDQARKRHKTLPKDMTDPINLSSGFHDKRKELEGEKDGMMPEKLVTCTGTLNDMKNSRSTSIDNSGLLTSSHVVHKEKEELRNAEKKIYSSMEPDLLKLCDVFDLSEEVKKMAVKFLEFIINTHRVDQQPEFILQAFKISLCWQAASFLKHNVDHKETLALARSCLGFECSIDQANSVFSKLHSIIMENFSHKTNALKSGNKQSSGMNRGKDVDCVHETTSKPQISDRSETEESEPSSTQQRRHYSIELVSEQTQPVIVVHPKVQKVSITSMDLESQINVINELFQDRTSMLFQKETDELLEFNRKKEEEKMKLMKKAMVLIKPLDLDSAAASNRLKILLQKFEERKSGERRRLKLMQIDARNKEREIKNKWISEAKAGMLTESFYNLPLTNSGFRLEDENPNIEEDITGDINYFYPELDNVDALCHMNTRNSNLEMPISEGRTVITAMETEDMISQILDRTLHTEPNNTNMSVTSSVVAKHITSMETEIQASQLQLDILQNVEPSNAQIASGISEAGLYDDEIENVTQASQFHATTAVGQTPDATDNEHLVVHGNSDDASLKSSALQNQLELPSPSRISANPFENSSLHPEVPLTISLQPSLVPEVGLSDFPSEAVVPSIRSSAPAADSILINDRIIPVTGEAEQQQHTQILGPIQQSESSGHPPVDFLEDFTGAGTSESRSFLPQILSMAIRIPQVYHPDPFENEFIKLGKLGEVCTKMHEDKKQKLMFQLEQEMDMVKKKFEALFQTAETEFVHEKELFGIIYKKVMMNHKLAEEFSKRFIEPQKERSVTSGGQSSMQQNSLPQHSHRPAECIPMHASVPNTVVGPSTMPSLAPTQSVRLHSPLSALSSSPIRALVPNRISIQNGSEPRAPAPHLQRSRSRPPLAVPNLPLLPGHVLQPLAHLSSQLSSAQASHTASTSGTWSETNVSLS